MNPEQAWLATMGQLKMDMSKAAFDTWVKNCELVGYENGRFTISVSNPYARDWLESRLSNTVTQVLTGIMNHPQEVTFILNAQDEETGISAQTRSPTNGGDNTTGDYST